MTRADGMTRLSLIKLKFAFSNALNKTVAALLPISKAGCVIVVNGGLRMEAVSRLEKQTTFTSLGISNFNETHAL